MKAEIERLRAAHQANDELVTRACDRAEVLRKENERLRATIGEIRSTLDDYATTHRMWAYALRRIRRLIDELDIPLGRDKAS
jgi:hypothetical protein